MTKLALQYASLDKQNEELIKIIQLNPNLKELLAKIKLPNDLPWYLAAGCINQTVWNYLTDREITYGISDYDLIYWDESLAKEDEERIGNEVASTFSNLGINIEVVNQARVHTWYQEDFGVPIKQYQNIEAAIDTWPSTATCLAVTSKSSKIEVYAPCGLSDIFGMRLRYNPSTTIPKEYIPAKLTKWTSKWPELIVVENSYPEVKV